MTPPGAVRPCFAWTAHGAAFAAPCADPACAGRAWQDRRGDGPRVARPVREGRRAAARGGAREARRRDGARGPAAATCRCATRTGAASRASPSCGPACGSRSPARSRSAGLRRARRLTLYEIRLEDGSGRLEGDLVQPALPEGRAADAARAWCCSGSWSATRTASRLLVMRSPQYEVVEDDEHGGHPHRAHRAGLREARPAHGQAAAARARRSLPDQVPDDLPDPLPAEVRERLGVIGRARGAARACTARATTTASRRSTLPRSPAHLRLILEEFFLFQLGLAAAAQRRARPSARASPSRSRDAAREAVKRILPFQLTGAQKRVLREIADDLRLAASHEPPGAGRRRLGQDHGGAALDGGRRRERLPGRVHGARPRSWPSSTS